MNKLILASSSPRRRELLSKFNVDFDIVTSDIEEKIDSKENPRETAMSLAFQKAFDVCKNFSNGEIVIGADTIVYCDEILGKPNDRDQAIKMINKLNGNEHFVITGIAIMKAGSNKKIVDYSITKVKFRSLTKDKIKDYIDTSEYEDKAGGYAIQGFGQVLVEAIDGSYSNVVGLPMSKLDFLLEKHFDMKLL